MAPVEGGPQRLLPNRRVAGPAGEQREATTQPGQQRPGRQEQPHAGRGQLDRPAGARPGGGRPRPRPRRSPAVTSKSGSHRRGPFDEQRGPPRTPRRARVGPQQVRRSGSAQRRDRVPCSPERRSGARLVASTTRRGHAARRSDTTLRGAEHMLAVVQHQQEPLLPEVARQASASGSARATPARPARARPPAGPAQDRPAAPARRATPRRGRRPARRAPRRPPQGEAGLAHAPRPGQGQQAYPVSGEPLPQRSHLRAPGRRSWSAGPADCAGPAAPAHPPARGPGRRGQGRAFPGRQPQGLGQQAQRVRAGGAASPPAPGR